MKEQTMWMLSSFILGALPLLVATIAITELLGVRSGAGSHSRTKRYKGGKHGSLVQNR